MKIKSRLHYPGQRRLCLIPSSVTDKLCDVTLRETVNLWEIQFPQL